MYDHALVDLIKGFVDFVGFVVANREAITNLTIAVGGFVVVTKVATTVSALHAAALQILAAKTAGATLATTGLTTALRLLPWAALAVGARPFQEWEIYEDKLLTNSPTIVVDYQFSVPENKMPVYFVQLLKYMMAWHLAEPLTDQATKAQYWQSVAVGAPSDNGRGGYFRIAANIDGQGQTPQAIEDFSLIAVRY